MEEYEGLIEAWTAPLDPLLVIAGTLGGTLPEMDGGDFSVAYPELAAYGTAYEFAEYTGETFGTGMSYARAGSSFISEVMPYSTGALVTFMLACGIWIVFMRVSALVFSFVMWVVSGIKAAWDSIFEVVPTGG